MECKNLFRYYDHLSGISGYCISEKSEQYYRSFEDAIVQLSPARRLIDIVGILGIIMKNYSLGNRTIAQELKKIPWLSKPIEPMGWKQAQLPSHGTLVTSAEEIGRELNRRLYVELLAFVQGKSTVGILLSGGMDSRIVASLLKQLQNNGDFGGNVVALTWGINTSRDVYYAQKIAKMFSWDFKLFPLSMETVLSNISITAELGAEFSPIHLHAMPQIARCPGIDGIVAGSYGDSIGRGEYSGRKVSQLPFLLDKNLNKFSLLRLSLENSAIKDLVTDIQSERRRFPGRSELSYREIEMQVHYMRRQLNSCMEIINKNIPLYQAFTDPKVFGYMWSLHPRCRNDAVYQSLLHQHSPELLDVPWARTGQVYNRKDSKVADNYTALHNMYGKWLRCECRQYIIKEINSGYLQSLNIFNEKALEQWCRCWSHSSTPRADRLDEKMAWLAALSKCIQKYKLKGISLESRITTPDIIRSYRMCLEYKLYRAAIRLKR